MVIFRRAVQLLAELVVVASCWKLISDMNTSLGIVTFNAQSATNRARLTEILNEFSGVDIVCLQGTKHATTNIEVSHMRFQTTQCTCGQPEKVPTPTLLQELQLLLTTRCFLTDTAVMYGMRLRICKVEQGQCDLLSVSAFTGASLLLTFLLMGKARKVVLLSLSGLIVFCLSSPLTASP